MRNSVSTMDYQKASTIFLLFYLVSSGLTVPLKRSSDNSGRVSTPEILDLEKQLKQQAGEDKKVSDDTPKGILGKPSIPVDALDPQGKLREPVMQPVSPGKIDDFIEKPPGHDGSGDLFQEGPLMDEYSNDVRKESMDELFDMNKKTPASSQDDDEFLDSVLDTLRKHPGILNEVLEDAAEEILGKEMTEDNPDGEHVDDDKEETVTDRNDAEDMDDAIMAERLAALNDDANGGPKILPQVLDDTGSLEDANGKVYAEEKNAEDHPLLTDEMKSKGQDTEVDFVRQHTDSLDKDSFGQSNVEDTEVDFDRSRGRNPKHDGEQKKRTEDSNQVKPNESSKGGLKVSMQQQLEDLTRELSGKNKRNHNADDGARSIV